MKTAEELNALKEEVEILNKKLHDLTEEELAQVSGGLIPPYPPIGQSPSGKFEGTFDGNSKAVRIDIGFDSDPQPYDCSGLIS